MATPVTFAIIRSINSKTHLRREFVNRARCYIPVTIAFYQMIEYEDDVDLAKKIQEWENFYNYQRPHGGLKGKTPYEVLKSKLS